MIHARSFPHNKAGPIGVMARPRGHGHMLDMVVVNTQSSMLTPARQATPSVTTLAEDFVVPKLGTTLRKRISAR